MMCNDSLHRSKGLITFSGTGGSNETGDDPNGDAGDDDHVGLMGRLLSRKWQYTVPYFKLLADSEYAAVPETLDHR